MKFIVSRVSCWNDDDQPCEGATRESCIRVDERVTDDPRKIGFYGGKSKWWFDEGENHRVEAGHIKRDFPVERWFIDIVSLEALIDFIGTHGDILIGSQYDDPSRLRIEIYDDYRE